MIFEDEENGSIEVNTPKICDIFPAIGFVGGLLFGAIKKEQRIDKVFNYAILGSMVGLLPKGYYLMAGLSHAKRERELQKEAKRKKQEDLYAQLDEASPVLSEKASAAPKLVARDVDTDDIMKILDLFSDSTDSSLVWLPRRTHFEELIEKSFSQDEKNAFFDLIYLASTVNPNPTEQEMVEMVNDFKKIEADYGNDIYEKVNSHLEDISTFMNREKSEESTKMLAA